MKKVRIRSVDDFEELPEDEWVEVEGGDLEVELIEEVEAKLIISDEGVKIPVGEELYRRLKDKKISVVQES
jgi:hypothetical protein